MQLFVHCGGAPKLRFRFLCLGHVKEFYPRPMLETEGWAVRQQLQSVVYENSWNQSADFVKEHSTSASQHSTTDSTT